MSNMELDMKSRIEEIEAILKDALPAKEGYPKTIFDAMEYALMGGGKRLRPLIMSEVYKMYGKTDMSIISHYMAAIEMIHTYSLIHDDLPAMDDDDYRRGRKTTHIVYGEDMGILAGDALLNYAYELAAGGFLKGNSNKQMRAFQVLASKAGVYGMVGGQVVDVEMNGQIPDMDMLKYIYENKTGALLEASFMIGGILADASDEDVETLKIIARKIGVAFQIQDDILDVTSTTEVLGKPVGSDEKNQKSTYVTFNGMEASKKAVEDMTNEALVMFDGLDTTGDKTFLRELLVSLITRDR